MNRPWRDVPDFGRGERRDEPGRLTRPFQALTAGGRSGWGLAPVLSEVLGPWAAPAGPERDSRGGALRRRGFDPLETSAIVESICAESLVCRTRAQMVAR